MNRIRSGPGGRLLEAIVTDDEPIYWPRVADWDAKGYSKVNGGVRRSDLMLDFNPATVRAAARDGVKLDPTDGLSAVERQWLQENNARYVAMICQAIRSALTASGGAPDLRERITTTCWPSHSFRWMTTGIPVGKSVWFRPAIGLEAFDERYFTRARDLGRWRTPTFSSPNPAAETARSWEPNFRAWHDAGCSSSSSATPVPRRTGGGFSRPSGSGTRPSDGFSALSALVQEAAIEEWRQASYR